MCLNWHHTAFKVTMVKRSKLRRAQLDLSSALVLPPTPTAPRARQKRTYSELDGPSRGEANKIQRAEQNAAEQNAADRIAEENAVAAVLGEEKSWYWERKKAPFELLAVPVGEEKPEKVHWQTMKDPTVRLLLQLPDPLLSLFCVCRCGI